MLLSPFTTRSRDLNHQNQELLNNSHYKDLAHFSLDDATHSPITPVPNPRRLFNMNSRSSHYPTETPTIDTYSSIFLSKTSKKNFSTPFKPPSSFTFIHPNTPPPIHHLTHPNPLSPIHILLYPEHLTILETLSNHNLHHWIP